jgi:hypothetical protein
MHHGAGLRRPHWLRRSAACSGVIFVSLIRLEGDVAHLFAAQVVALLDSTGFHSAELC